MVLLQVQKPLSLVIQDWQLPCDTVQFGRQVTRCFLANCARTEDDSVDRNWTELMDGIKYERELLKYQEVKSSTKYLLVPAHAIKK
jgi:hypothetical protein